MLFLGNAIHELHFTKMCKYFYESTNAKVPGIISHFSNQAIFAIISDYNNTDDIKGTLRVDYPKILKTKDTHITSV